MKRLIELLLLIATIVAAWSVAVSYLWCRMSTVCLTGEWRLLQWWFVLPYWKANWWVTLLVLLSAFLPSAIIGIVLYAIVVFRSKPKSPVVYGQTEWANRDKMADNGISSRPRPF